MKDFKGQRIVGKVYRNEDFSGADFSGAELTNVVFRNCDFRGADFSGLKLEGTKFEDCRFDFIGTSVLNNIKLIQFERAGIRVKRVKYKGNYEIKSFSILPCDMFTPMDTDGEDLIVYKKIHVDADFINYDNAVAKLRIPFYADRITYENDKCRASCAQVVDIYDENDIHYDSGSSMYYQTVKCEYRPKHMVYADSFNDNPFEICSNGIHFFLTEEEAWDYIC